MIPLNPLRQSLKNRFKVRGVIICVALCIVVFLAWKTLGRSEQSLVSAPIKSLIHPLSNRTEYSCPDLYNAQKRTIEPLTQGYDGWFFRRNDLKMDFSISPQTALYFKRLSDVLAEKNVHLLIVPLLSRAMMAANNINHGDAWQENYDLELARSSYQDFIKTLKTNGVDAVDMTTVIDQIAHGDPYQYNFKRDIHWKPEGSRLTAKTIADLLRNAPNYNAMTKVKTVSKPGIKVARAGTITEELQKLCNGTIEAEPYQIFNSQRQIAQNADALFGSTAETVPVALIGTSFSFQNEFNFSGFLEEYSELAVSNFAIAGGGMFTSLISYLSSPYFQENIPPVIIWETQSVYEINKSTENLFRQAIPAVYGVCSEERTRAHKTVDISPTDKPILLLDDLEKYDIKGQDYYLYLASDNLGFKKFTLEMNYDDGDGEWFPIDRSDRYNNKGFYFIELSDKISSSLKSVYMTDIQQARTKIDIRLCQRPLKTSTKPTETEKK